MREIKFRGKQTAHHRPWIYGSLLMLDGKAYILDDGDTSASIDPSSDPESGTTYVEGLVEVDPDTIGQYTGLNDIEGREIYEGDIVRFAHNRQNKTPTVAYRDGAFSIGIRVWADGKVTPISVHAAVKVIGNIHDSPELLE